jgi:hypothetical protein
MMSGLKSVVLTGVLTFGCSVLVGATAEPGQAADTRESKPDPKKPIVMDGCVSADATTGRITFTDTDGGQYRLTGTNVGRYVGRRVQIVGGPATKRLRIVGGLTPSPNVAGQGSAIDPVQAAMAAQGSQTGVGSPQLPEFRVSRVSAVTGTCTPQ